MAFKIDKDTQIGAVALTVSDLDKSISFYEKSLGFKTRTRSGSDAELGTDTLTLIKLHEKKDAQHPHGTAGLYHFAVLTPNRFELGQVLANLIRTQTPVQGFADHGVSEAIYLPDPDGNGIEMYRDRPRDEWPRTPDGAITMVTDPLDLEGILQGVEGKTDGWTHLHPDTRMGHMHLKVSQVDPAEAFYRDVLGFDVIKNLHSASFISAGGYHHHLGMNVWESRSGPPQSPDAVGLRWYEIKLPTEAALGQTADAARKAGSEFEETNDGLLLRDPSQNGVMLVSG